MDSQYDTVWYYLEMLTARRCGLLGRRPSLGTVSTPLFLLLYTAWLPWRASSKPSPHRGGSEAVSYNKHFLLPIASVMYFTITMRKVMAEVRRLEFLR